ncbi:MAG TPA: hemolysin family protein [Acidimicrobiales bacterium]|nr:hemolysin family protein [Acidimicrobiales bacterium]
MSQSVSLLASTSHISSVDYAELGAAVVLLAASSVLSMAETALTRTSRVKAMSLRDEGKRGAATLVRVVEHPEKFLNTVLLLVLFCQLVAATFVSIVFDHLFGALGVLAATAFEVIFVFVVGEAAPKTWAVQHAERSALIAAPLVGAIMAFPPMAWVVNGLIVLANAILPGKGFRHGPFVSERELLAMADVAADEKVIETEERALIRSIISFGDTVVRAVMVPRPDMVSVAGSDPIGKVIEKAIAAGFSRIPVYDQGLDDVIGVVYTKDLMRAGREGRADQPVRTLARAAHFVPEAKKVAELMREMQHEKFHMAIAVDEYGGTAGLVTLEDLIEELVGEIVDEFDVEEPLIEALPDGVYRVNARMPVAELNELVRADLPTGEWDTVGGMVFTMLGHVPAEGESVLADGHRLVAEKVQGRRIGRVRVIPVESAPQETDQEG